MWLNKCGKWERIIIDDRIIVDENDNPVFSRSADDEIWLILIEKAYAKMYGGYSKI